MLHKEGKWEKETNLKIILFLFKFSSRLLRNGLIKVGNINIVLEAINLALAEVEWMESSLFSSHNSAGIENSSVLLYQ